MFVSHFVISSLLGNICIFWLTTFEIFLLADRYCLILVLRYKSITFHCKIVVYEINRTTLEYYWILPCNQFWKFLWKGRLSDIGNWQTSSYFDFMLFLLSYTRSVSVNRSKVLSLVSSTTSLFSSKRETRNLCTDRITFSCLLYV